MLRVWLFSFQENVELPTSNIPVINNTYDPCNTRTSLMPKYYFCNSYADDCFSKIDDMYPTRSGPAAMEEAQCTKV